jgi:hypothetical protein
MKIKCMMCGNILGSLVSEDGELVASGMVKYDPASKELETEPCPVCIRNLYRENIYKALHKVADTAMLFVDLPIPEETYENAAMGSMVCPECGTEQRRVHEEWICANGHVDLEGITARKYAVAHTPLRDGKKKRR